MAGPLGPATLPNRPRDASRVHARQAHADWQVQTPQSHELPQQHWRSLPSAWRSEQEQVPVRHAELEQEQPLAQVMAYLE